MPLVEQKFLPFLSTQVHYIYFASSYFFVWLVDDDIFTFPSFTSRSLFILSESFALIVLFVFMLYMLYRPRYRSCRLGSFILLLYLNSEFVGKYWMTNIFCNYIVCTFVYVCQTKKKLICKGNLPLMFKYLSILNIITSWIILKIIYMCFEFQMEQNICMRMPTCIYDLVRLLCVR